ncbi:MAG: alanine--glyoxylate aminotransferase family protein [Kordiimonadaceae bacterium]|nr:alanine--glyoxylate aminotransferase family protein [Kordiimonadaceae bacterium]MBO6569299.1 alanine--glyoxylate aminotransferase family protein [Kordiimonadaceae bacterium]MBO6964775.1 alanine--glyoxylate aminotransferase family protein [Kordiimonadaceae bacterium]
MKSFHPAKRLLMGPGPSDVHPRILEAMARPTLGHLDPDFQGLMEEIKTGLKQAFQTKHKMTYPVSAPGSAGMETCFVNLVEEGDKVVIVKHGVFGERMRQNVLRAGGEPVMVEFDWGTAPDLNLVEQVLNQNTDAKILAFVHAETSTGVRADAAALCKLAKDHDCLTIVDAVTSLAGIPVLVDDWGVDAIYSGSQKCLSCTPGLSPVSFSEAALEKIRNRKSMVRSWFLDLTLVMDYWEGEGGRSYHHTAPVNALYGLHESLVMLFEEGLNATFERHRMAHDMLVAGLSDLGLEMFVAAEDRLPQLNAVAIPEGVDEAAVRSRMLNDHGIEIGAGLGPLAGKIWRIGLMGNSARPEAVERCLNGLEASLKAGHNS